jgi:hypothetical protein
VNGKGNKDVRVEPTEAKFANLAAGELFEPAQVETFKDISGKRFVFYSRPGDDGNSRYSGRFENQFSRVVTAH